MESFLNYCTSFYNGDGFPLALIIFMAGLVGSVTHCSVMCSSFAASNLFDIRQRESCFWQVVTYHAGRIATYIMLGILAVYAARFVFAGNLQNISHIVLMAAGILFIISAIAPRKTHKCQMSKFEKWLGHVAHFFSLKAVSFIRGAMMGLMPCGMVVSVLLMVSTVQSVLYAALLMAIFGLATTPMLHSAAWAIFSLGKHQRLLNINMGRVLMAFNGLVLCGLGFIHSY